MTIDGRDVRVKGPKGTLSRTISAPITIEKNDEGQLVVARPDDERNSRALHGLTRTLVNNMVIGVTKGYSKTLELVGTGYRAQVDGNKLTLNVGYSHPVEFIAPKDVSFETPNATTVVVKGISKQVVGNLAADIRAVRPPEPYLGKGIKYQDEHIRRKVGKSGN